MVTGDQKAFGIRTSVSSYKSVSGEFGMTFVGKKNSTVFLLRNFPPHLGWQRLVHLGDVLGLGSSQPVG